MSTSMSVQALTELPRDDLEIIVQTRLASQVEAEKILGIRPRTFSKWLKDGRLPEPILVLANGTKVWDVHDLEGWGE